MKLQRWDFICEEKLNIQNISDYINCKQVYNVTSDGKIVKFQPDNSPENGYHSYEVSSPRDIPNNVRKEMENDGKFRKAVSNKLRKGNVKKK